MAPQGDSPSQDPLRLANFLHISQVIGVPSSPLPSALPAPLSQGLPEHLSSRTLIVRRLPQELQLPLLAALLVTLPVFAQAPWVRHAPLAASLFTAPMLAGAILLALHGRGGWRDLGVLLVGFSGSWLAGSVFWGWFRLHPLWHLPIEAFALPLAVAGLRGRWQLAGAFYLASLVGTAATDGVMAISGIMPLWPLVVTAPPEQAGALLQQAALLVLQPLPLAMVLGGAALLLWLAQLLWRRGGIWRVSAAALATTVSVDGLFVAAALLAPSLSGLI